MRTTIFLIVLSSVFMNATGQASELVTHLPYDHFISLKQIPEPSDIVYDTQRNSFWIVSDHGMLFECTREGKILRKAPSEGSDFEGVEVVDSFVYVSDEIPRKVYQYSRSDLSLLRVFNVTWHGALNKAFESIAYNHSKSRFVLVSQQPVVLIEYDDNFHETARYPLSFSRDISAARWYKGLIYFLGNLDRSIYRCDPITYDVKETYTINVLNPEGLCFDVSGNIIIVSDDLQRLYYFNQIPNKK